MYCIYKTSQQVDDIDACVHQIVLDLRLEEWCWNASLQGVAWESLVPIYALSRNKLMLCAV